MSQILSPQPSYELNIRSKSFFPYKLYTVRSLIRIYCDYQVTVTCDYRVQQGRVKEHACK